MTTEISRVLMEAGIDDFFTGHISEIYPDFHLGIQHSIATSLKRIADNLDLVIDHNSFPNTSIAVSSHGTRSY